MIQLTDIRNAYVFVNTSNPEIASNAKKLAQGLYFQPFVSRQNNLVLSGIFYKEKLLADNNTFYSIDKINDQGDYDLGRFLFSKVHKLDKQFDSIISYCFFNKQGFVAGTDYMSIFNHYYYHDKHTFICSNNMLIVARLCDDVVSDEALFETLFFRFPFRKGTFFKSVKCMKPYQQLQFTSKGELNVSSSIIYSDLILDGDFNLDKNIDQFFSQLQNPNNLPSSISFSGGSDSMTILSILKKKKIDCHLVSFAGTNETDTKRIKKLVARIGCPFYFDQSEKFEVNLNEELNYAFLTNGYSPSLHFYRFYKNLPEKFQIFDGYSAVLGDWSEAFLHFPYRQVLQGQNIDLVLKKNFAAFEDEFLFRMKKYLLDNYHDIFKNINTEEGLQNLRQYAVEFVPSKILTRVYKCNSNFGHLNVSFFQSRKFITFVEKNNFGLARTCTARHDYPGYVINRLPLGIIAHNMDKKIIRLPLSYGLSLNDLYLNHQFVPLKKKLHVFNKKLHTFGRKPEVKPVHLETIDLGHFDFVKPGLQLNYHTKRELSLFNTIYLIMDKMDTFLKEDISIP